MKNVIVFILCLVGWSAFGYHVFQGYGFDHAIGVVGFLVAAIGHSIQYDVIGFKSDK